MFEVFFSLVKTELLLLISTKIFLKNASSEVARKVFFNVSELQKASDIPCLPNSSEKRPHEVPQTAHINSLDFTRGNKCHLKTRHSKQISTLGLEKAGVVVEMKLFFSIRFEVGKCFHFNLVGGWTNPFEK